MKGGYRHLLVSIKNHIPLGRSVRFLCDEYIETYKTYKTYDN